VLGAESGLSYQLRKARNDDREAVISIMNYFVENSFGAYPDEKIGNDYFDAMKGIAKVYPFYVIETQNQVVGFGLLRCYGRWETLKRAAEVTYFILPAHTRKGLGRRLLDVLIEDAKKLGIDTLLVNISSRNKTSLSFHEKNGFKKVGRFRRIGKKFGKDFDIIWMQKFI
jgi:L-amino acid N-acyltransferase YncA